MKTSTLLKKLPATFDRLAGIMIPHAIRDDIDYDNVGEIMNSLAILDHRTKGQDEYLETLTQLVEAYDDANYPIEDSVSGVEALKLLLDQNDMTASDLGRLLGNRELGSKILRGERELSKAHIRILADRFKVLPGLFL